MKRSILMAASMAVVLGVGSTSGLGQHGRGGGAGPQGPASTHGASAASAHANSAASSNSGPEVLTKNTKLDSKLTAKLQSKGLLPPGTDLKTACAGFRNLGQCMAAIHVSHNRDIPFACLKADMTGAAPTGSICPAVTGTSKMSLGKAIQTLDPKADAKAEAKKAAKQAEDDIKESQSESSS
jgi:hypothetical protein